MTNKISLVHVYYCLFWIQMFSECSADYLYHTCIIYLLWGKLWNVWALLLCLSIKDFVIKLDGSIQCHRGEGIHSDGHHKSSWVQAPLFGLFLMIYVISVVWNLGMIILTIVDSRLQTPMYFFLRHLALTDLGYSTVVGSKILVNFVTHQNKISYNFCATQLAVFLMFIAYELFILSGMSYDRYVAICNPLLYSVLMSQRVCQVLVAVPYLYICVSSNNHKDFHFILLWL
jgi:hypothetical protein